MSKRNQVFVAQRKKMLPRIKWSPIEKALEMSAYLCRSCQRDNSLIFSPRPPLPKRWIIEANGVDINVKGDKLTVLVDSKTNLYLLKKFSSLMGKDLIEGEMKYETFSSGINHGSTTVLELPAQNDEIQHSITGLLTASKIAGSRKWVINSRCKRLICG